LGHLSLRFAEEATVGGKAGYIKKFLIPSIIAKWV